VQRGARRARRGAGKRERHARRSDAAANPQAPATPGRRKVRRPGQEEPAPPPAVEGPAYPPAAEGPAYPPVPNLAPAAPAATEASPPPAPTGSHQAAGPAAPTPAQPAFLEPLP